MLGLVIAAIFSAAMGTLAGSLNSAASTIVNDLYRPVTGRNDERHLMRVSRVMTVVWGVVLTAVAFGARLLKDNVVNKPWRSPASSRASCSGCSCWGS